MPRASRPVVAGSGTSAMSPLAAAKASKAAQSAEVTSALPPTDLPKLPANRPKSMLLTTPS